MYRPALPEEAVLIKELNVNLSAVDSWIRETRGICIAAMREDMKRNKRHQEGDLPADEFGRGHPH
ncbi:hypothetical protein J6590_002179 [Homalodisca vitripennis]|nr:hypothetical protein J6590_002179 [Homalodisca vitripennis]